MRRVLSTRKVGRYQQRGRGAGWTAALVAVVAVLGSGQTAPESQPAESLKQRVTAFWEARLQGDAITAYQYEAYAHTGKMTATQYVQSRSSQLTYTEYTIKEIQEQDNAAQVEIAIKCQLAVPGMADVSLDEVIEERWTRLDDGQWYRNNRRDKRSKPNRKAAKQG